LPGRVKARAAACDASGPAHTRWNTPNATHTHTHTHTQQTQRNARTLHPQLLDPSRASADGDSLAAAQAEHGNAAEQYMASVRNLMHMAGSNLADVPSKVEFVRQRISQVRRLRARAGLGGRVHRRLRLAACV
jgi:hypothetical protein